MSATPSSDPRTDPSTDTLATALAGVLQCSTCGVEVPADSLPAECPICADERQYLPEDGVQRWTDPREFTGRIDLVEREPGLIGLRVRDGVGIGQEAKLLVTDHGLVMFDVPAAITPAAVDAVRALGTLRAIIPSHPHMYGLQSAWSAALDDAPVWIAAADAHWVQHAPTATRTVEGTEEVLPGVTAAVLGGHFPGNCVVHWTGQDGKGVLLSGDTIAPNPDRRTVTFMRSFPNRIPLSGAVALRVAEAAARFDFDRIYGNFENVVPTDARGAVLRSAERFAAWTSGEYDHLT